MRIRTIGMSGLATTLLGLTFVAPAHAQRANNVGQQIERQLLNNVSSSITGQPSYGYPNQPNNAYPGMQGGYAQPGYPQRGPGYYPQGAAGYQQPQQGYYPQQQPQQGYYPQQQPQQNYYAQQPPQRGYYPQQPATAPRYQLPAQYAGAAPGSPVSYGGANYVVNADGTMSPGTAAPAPPVNSSPRYQIPPQFAATAPGSVVGYNGASYVINTDGTMSPSNNPVAR